MIELKLAFDAVDAMNPGDRLELCRLLRDPDGRCPVVPSEVAELPVPTAPADQLAVLDLIDRTLRATVGGPLAGRTLGEIVPTLASAPGGVDSSAGTTNRLNALILAFGSASWSALAEQRVADILARRGAGAATTAQLIGHAVRAALRHLESDIEPCPPESPVDDRRSPDSRALVAVLNTLTDHRTRAIFEQADLRLDDIATDARPSPGQLASLVGLGRERCRQLRLQAGAIVLEAAGRDPTVGALAVDLALQLGTAVTLDDIGGIVGCRGLGGLDDPAAMLAVWLAGPYFSVPDHPGWMSPQPADLAISTRRMLADSGGVNDHSSIVDDLIRGGVSQRSAEVWLRSQPVRFEHGLIVHLLGRAVVIAERALEATGTAMSTIELQAWIPDAADAALLPRELRHASQFVETGPGRWELTEWGGEPSEHLLRFAVELTPSAMIGDPGAVDPALADLLALRTGTPKHFPTRFGPLSFLSDGVGVQHGSIRPIALACGAAVGAMLAFVIDPRTVTAAVDVMPRDLRYVGVTSSSLP